MGGGDGHGRDVGIGLVRFEGGGGASDVDSDYRWISFPFLSYTSPPPRVGVMRAGCHEATMFYSIEPDTCCADQISRSLHFPQLDWGELQV